MDNKMFLIGNAHIDPVWLWRWQEGFSEIKSTFRSALDRMDEFDKYVFTAAGASYYKWVEENEPAMFEEIKKRVAEGRWIIAGGWWLQPDCNLPSGESFARHGLYAQRYYFEKFGKIATFGYNVDSFGHNAMLPQILSKCQMENYIMMRPENHEKLLSDDVFWWEGVDGTRVLTYRIYYGYATSDKPGNLEWKYQAVRDRMLEKGTSSMLFYGVGNHGGGPTISCLRKLENYISENEDMKFSGPDEFFNQVSKNEKVNLVVSGDLQHHAIGCYSAFAQIKADNRKAENRLIACEKMMTIANNILGLEYKQEKIQQAWEDVMLNQFHDVLGGCSIKEAYEDAREVHGEALKISGDLLNSSLQKLSWNIDTANGQTFAVGSEFDWNTWENQYGGMPVVIFNTNSWEVDAVLELSKDVTGVVDRNKTPLPFQKVRSGKTFKKGHDYQSIIQLKIPPLGYSVIYIYKTKEIENPISKNIFNIKNTSIENNWYKLDINSSTGTIKSLFDKENNVSIFKGDAAVAEVIDDFKNDTWGHGEIFLNDKIGVFEKAKLQVVERGDIRATIRCISKYNNSTLTQEFTMYRDKKDIDVSVTLNWEEDFKILKLAFPIDAVNNAAIYEIAYGNIKKDADGKEEPGQGWVNVTGKGKNDEVLGVSIVNNCKYSYDVSDNVARFIAVRSAAYADHGGYKDESTQIMDKGLHQFKYSIIPNVVGFSPSIPTKKAFEMCQPPVAVYETYHTGELSLEATFASIDASNVIINVIKKCEDDDSVVIRAYETDGIECDASINLDFIDFKFTEHFKRNEIKTLKITKQKEIISTNILERNYILD